MKMLKVAFFLLFTYLKLVVADHDDHTVPVTLKAVSINESCLAEKEAENVRNSISQDVRNLLQRTVIPSFGCHIGECEANPARSCSEIQEESGDYWIRRCDGVAVQVYCELDASRFNSNETGGWMRVAYLNATDPNQQCPHGLNTFEQAGIRSCVRVRNNYCVSTFYDSNCIVYSRVCGRVIGYQQGSPDAFGPYFNDQSMTIDDDYVDGLSVTHGHSPRKHIWTFAAAVDENGPADLARCPCTNNNTAFTGAVPPFIGQDYFCDTGSRDRWQRIFYPDDPLWDGAGCGPTSTCCSFNNPPWFCKQLPQPTTDDIEVRFCGDQNLGDEHVPIELIEIYVL